MSVLPQIAEAHASALSLRASAQACVSSQGALRFRLMRAADALDSLALMALHLVERAGALEQDVIQLRKQARSPAADSNEERTGTGHER